MTTNIETELNQILERLSSRITEVVVDSVSRGLLHPTEDYYACDRIDSIKESEHGIEKRTWDTEFYTKESWGKAAIDVSGHVKECAEYIAASELLTQLSPSTETANHLLESFTYRIANKWLETNDQSQRQEFLNFLLLRIGKDVNKEPFTSTSEVRLVGLIAPSKGAKFTAAGTEVSLRRVTIEDFANEQRYFGFREHFPVDPSAILHLKISSTIQHEIQDKVWQSIAILRLFKAGRVAYLSHTVGIDSLLGFDGMIMTGGKPSGYGQCVIENDDAPKLEEFWRLMSEAMPADGYENKAADVDSTGIAYQQYSAALISPGATVERRISDVVMGLESLFLTRDENQELIYRLRTRVAKILGLLGRDPYAVKKIVNDAYTVRSAFVHGDRVREDIRKSIENRNGDFNQLLDSILDELRIAIVMFTLTKINKAELIRLIDSSFIDHNKLPELEKLLTPIKHLI